MATIAKKKKKKENEKEVKKNMVEKKQGQKKEKVHERFYTQGGAAITPDSSNDSKDSHVFTARELAERRRKNKAKAKKK